MKHRAIALIGMGLLAGVACPALAAGADNCHAALSQLSQTTERLADSNAAFDRRARDTLARANGAVNNACAQAGDTATDRPAAPSADRAQPEAPVPAADAASEETSREKRSRHRARSPKAG